MYHHMKSIHTKFDILVLSLGLGLMLFHDDRPCTIISKHTSILITHIWYWALVWTMCFFMMIDHVISPHPPFSIYRCVYIYVYTPIPNTQYIYIHIYVCIYPNTQYPIPNTKKGHQKIPFLLTSLHNSDLQSLLQHCNALDIGQGPSGEKIHALSLLVTGKHCFWQLFGQNDRLNKLAKLISMSLPTYNTFLTLVDDPS